MFEKRINSFYLHQIIGKKKPLDKVFGSLEIGLQKGVNGIINLRKVNMLKKMSVGLQMTSSKHMSWRKHAQF